MRDTEDKYYYGIWFVGDGQTGDWMGSLFKGQGKWIFEYRFRYYAEDDPSNDVFSGKDKKSWYTFATKDDSEEQLKFILKSINSLAPIMESQYRSKMDFVSLECMSSDPKFFFELGSKSWTQFKTMTMEEAKAKGYI